MHDGMVLTLVEVATGSFRMPPVGAWRPAPPLRIVAQVYGPFGRSEHKRPRYQSRFGWRRRSGGNLAHDLGGGGNFFRDGHVSGRCDEARELRVRDLGLVHPEAAYADGVCRPFVGP